MTRLISIIILFLIINSLAYSESIDDWNWTSYTEGINRTISKISQKQTAWLRENCGLKQDRSAVTIREVKRKTGFKIYGGQLTRNFEYPWVVGLEIRVYTFEHLNDNTDPIMVGDDLRLCSGTFFSMQHVLTAQHCFTNKLRNGTRTRLHYASETTFKAKITLGKGNTDVGYRYVAEEQSRYVPDLDFHSNQYTRLKFDWALVELKDKVPQNLIVKKTVVSVCLPASDEIVESFDCVEIYGEGGMQATGPHVGVGSMRYIYTTISTTHVYGVHQRLFRDVIAIKEHLSREINELCSNSSGVYYLDSDLKTTFGKIMQLKSLPYFKGDSGGGITKAVYVFLKDQCKHVLVGITRRQQRNRTIAVDVRNVRDLTGILL